MNRAIALIVFLVSWTVAAFVAGWQVRDGRADAAVATQETATQAARADVAEQARSTDHGNAQASAGVEVARLERSAERAQKFDSLKTEVAEYAKAAAIPDPAVPCLRGDADARFLRAWDEASAAAYQRAGHHDPASADRRAESAPATHGKR